jgi:hypothetical protein
LLRLAARPASVLPPSSSAQPKQPLSVAADSFLLSGLFSTNYPQFSRAVELAALKVNSGTLDASRAASANSRGKPMFEIRINPNAGGSRYLQRPLFERASKHGRNLLLV